jgi:uncharacterized lipoprotein YmbA
MRNVLFLFPPIRSALLSVIVTIAACSSVPVHFYTLSSAESGNTRAAGALFAIDVLPVAIPAQVSVPQFVVRDSEQTVMVLEHERWSAPLQDEIRVAISHRLVATLGAVDASRISNANLPTYRVRIDVQRFDAWLDRSVSVDAVWTLTAPGKSEVALLCPMQLGQTATSGYAGLVQAYQQVLNTLGDQIALAVREGEMKQKLSCADNPSAR